jgi:hypothetical protein
LPPKSGGAGSGTQLSLILGDKAVDKILAVLRDELVDPGGVVLLTFRREGESDVGSAVRFGGVGSGSALGEQLAIVSD